VLKLFINYNLIAIKSLNIKGALIGSAACYIFACYMNYRSIKKYTGVRLNMKRLFNRPLSVSLIMGLFVFLIYKGLAFMTGWFLKSMLLQSLICGGIAIAAGCAVYFLLMIIAKGITAKDIKGLPMGGRILAYTMKIPFVGKHLMK
jgi:stage V sporulation protein B